MTRHAWLAQFGADPGESMFQHNLRSTCLVSLAGALLSEYDLPLMRKAGGPQHNTIISGTCFVHCTAKLMVCVVVGGVIV
eukprot:3804357-Amphidinium_carterae.1